MMDNDPAARGAQPPLDQKLQSHLGDSLRLLYAETARSPIPDRFSALLDQLQQVGVDGLKLSDQPQQAQQAQPQLSQAQASQSPSAPIDLREERK